MCIRDRGDVVEISGLVGSTPAVDRHQGFVKAISEDVYKRQVIYSMFT